MYRYLARVLSSRRGHQILPTLLALASFAILLWSISTDLRNGCVGSQADQTGVCLTTVEFVIPLSVALGFWAIGLLVWLVSQRTLVLAFFVLIADILAVGMLSGTRAATDEAHGSFTSCSPGLPR